MAYLANQQEGQMPAAAFWVGGESIQLLAFSPALATVKEIIPHVLELQALTDFADFPSCLAASTKAQCEEEKLAPVAAASTFEVGRVTFPRKSLVTL